MLSLFPCLVAGFKKKKRKKKKENGFEG